MKLKGTITRICSGDHTTEITGGWEVFCENFTMQSGKKSYIGGKEGTDYGTPEKYEEEIEDAFIPVVELIESKNYQYIFEEIENKIYELDDEIDADKKKQSAKKLRFISDEPLIKLTFKVTKGNRASKDDTGVVRAEIYFVNGEKDEQEIKTSYGETFDIYVDTKKLATIKFYADDNDWIFDGNVNNIFCGALNYDCQKPLKKQAVKSIAHLTKEQRAVFMATVLCESGNGKKELWDIAYIYLNLIHLRGSFEAAMKESSAYVEKSWVYTCHLRHLLIDSGLKKYSDFKDWENTIFGKKAIGNEQTIEDKVEIKRKEAKDFIPFCKEKIFIASPTSLYKDWEGQGNFEDMNIRMHNDKIYKREKWAMASHYFHLQNQCKVKVKLVVELFDKPTDIFKETTIIKEKLDGTTYIFNQKKIEEYFKKNPDKLPDYADGDVKYSTTGKIINDLSPKNAIPPVYGFRKK